MALGLLHPLLPLVVGGEVMICKQFQMFSDRNNRRTGVVGLAGLLLLMLAPSNIVHSQQVQLTNIAALQDATIQLVPIGPNPHSPVVTAIAITSQGELVAAAGDDHVIRIMDQQFNLIANLAGHSDWVQSLDFSPDGMRLVSVGNDGQMICWDRTQDWVSRAVLEGKPALRAAKFSPNGNTVATVGFCQQIYLWNVLEDTLPSLSCGCRDLRTIEFRSDSLMLAAAGRSGDVYLYDAVTGSTIGDVKLHNRRIREVKFIGNTNRIVTASEDGHAIVYDIDESSVVHDLHISGCKLFTLCLLGNSHLAVAGSDNIIRIFDLNSGVLVDQLIGHTGSVATLRSSYNTLYSGGFDTTLRRWNLSAILAGEKVVDGQDGDAVIRTSRRP